MKLLVYVSLRLNPQHLLVQPKCQWLAIKLVGETKQNPIIFTGELGKTELTDCSGRDSGNLY